MTGSWRISIDWIIRGAMICFWASSGRRPNSIRIPLIR